MTEITPTIYLDFNDYDSYIERRTQWRKDYAEISQEIRDWKNAHRGNTSMEAKAYYRFVKSRGLTDYPSPTDLYVTKPRDFNEWVAVKRQLPFKRVGSGTRSSSDAFKMLKIRALMKSKSAIQREDRVGQPDNCHDLFRTSVAA